MIFKGGPVQLSIKIAEFNMHAVHLDRQLCAQKLFCLYAQADGKAIGHMQSCMTVFKS